MKQPVAITQLNWRDPASDPPDADLRFLLWIRDEGSMTDWAEGFLCAEGWRFCESGGLVPGTVVAYADPAEGVAPLEALSC